MHYREHRWPCDYPVTVRMASGALRSEVINISSTGARLSPIDRVVAGDRIVLEIAGQSHPADVRWQRGGLCGLRFVRPISPRDLGLIRHAELRHVPPRSWRAPAPPLRELN